MSSNVDIEVWFMCNKKRTGISPSIFEHLDTWTLCSFHLNIDYTILFRFTMKIMQRPEPSEVICIHSESFWTHFIMKMSSRRHFSDNNKKGISFQCIAMEPILFHYDLWLDGVAYTRYESRDCSHHSTSIQSSRPTANANANDNILTNSHV